MISRVLLILLFIISLFSCNSSERKEEKNLPESITTEVGNESKNKANSWNGLQINSPAEGEVVSSPINIKGRAKGTWYFEANFGIKLLDENKKILAESYVSATEDWMTEDWVPFEGSIKFTAPETAKGFLIFEKANPSGLKENELTDTLQVKFRN